MTFETVWDNIVHTSPAGGQLSSPFLCASAGGKTCISTAISIQANQDKPGGLRFGDRIKVGIFRRIDFLGIGDTFDFHVPCISLELSHPAGAGAKE